MALFKLRASPQHLENLRKYKCSGDDKSIIRTYILNPYVYETLIHFVPSWLAPNVVTLIGFTFLLSSAVVCSIYSPTLSEELPSWVFFYNAFCLWIYQTFDNLDGKQARNTGQSSPLGEMFDHGCDAVGCMLGSFNWMVTCARGPSLFSYSLIFVGWLPFALATWEEYYVGGLFLGYINGPIEGLLSMQLAQIVGGVMGHSFFLKPVAVSIPALAFIFPFAANWQLATLLSVGTQTVAVLNSLLNVVNVYNRVKKNQHELATKGIPVEDRVWKETNFANALFKLIPFTILIGSVTIWIAISPAKIFAQHPYLLLVSAGLSFGYLASNVTLAFLLKVPLKNFSLSVCIPIMACVANALLAKVGIVLVAETTLLYIYSVISSVTYIYFALTVCLHISSYLEIGVLRIIPKTKAK